MNLKENILEGLRSVRSNLLRSVLTAAIVAIGISSLVGILTAIDSMQASISNSFASLGANTFTIRSIDPWRRQQVEGRKNKNFEPISLAEARKFRELFSQASLISISTMITGNAEAKYMSKKTNPNMVVSGVSDEYLSLKGYNLTEGRNFSAVESQYGSSVAVIGPEVRETLFLPSEEPIGKEFRILGTKFRVIGVLESAGSMGGNSGSDRAILIPLNAAGRFATSGALRYTVDVQAANPLELENVLGEATGLMRTVRRDRLGHAESFEVRQNKTAAEELSEISGYLRIGGFVIGIITLMGASIGLMNIMMVSVTERTREIGVRKALGATPQKIRRQFIIEAIVICLLGGIGGILFGIFVGNLVSTFVGEGVFIVPWLWMGMGVSICIAVGLFSGFYPAYKASKLDPVDSLRFE